MLHIKRFKRLFTAFESNASVMISRSSSVDYTYKNYNVTRRSNLKKVLKFYITLKGAITNNKKKLKSLANNLHP